MQSVGLQTVLQMGQTAERQHMGTVTQGNAAADQFKDAIEKAVETKTTEVPETIEAENAKIREEDQRRRRQDQQDKEKKAKDEAEKAEESIKAMPVDDVPQGRLLNIKV